jgi:hypothetical protein
MNPNKLKKYFGFASFIFYLMAALVFWYGFSLPEIMSQIDIVFCLLILSLVSAGMGEGIFKTITFIGFISIGSFCLLALSGLLDFLRF